MARTTLLTDLLRDRWGFDGIVVSDYFAVNQLFAFHQIVRDKEAAAAMALAAGLDVELPSTDCYGAPAAGRRWTAGTVDMNSDRQQRRAALAHEVRAGPV